MGSSRCNQCQPQARCAPSPHRGEGWGEGGSDSSRDHNPSPHPSPYGRGSPPSARHCCVPTSGGHAIVNETREPAGAARPPSAASEERLLESTEEFAASASRTTVLLTNLLQGLLIACVVLWVMDVPRQVFNVSFYTEQLLTVCLGLTLALAFVVETQREYRAIDVAGAIATVTILVYIAYRFPNPLNVQLLLWAGLALALAWTFLAGRPAFARAFDFAAAAVSLLLCGYIFVRYEPLTYELAMLPVEGIVGSAILLFLVLEASRRTSGFGFVGIILAMAVYIYI